jgi:hypothetical protein
VGIWKLALVVASCLLSISQVWAFEGKLNNIRGTAQSLYDAQVPFEFDANWKLETLLNEPLRNLNIRWRLPIAGKITGKNLTPFRGYQDSFPISDLPPHIRKTIRIYDLKVRVTLAQPQTSWLATVTFDAGVPGHAGTDWSYNVTGSPPWDEFMNQIGTGTHLTEEAAKGLMSVEQLEGRSGETMEAKVRLGEALRWLKRKSDKQSVQKMLKGAREHLYVLKSVLGLPTESMELEFNLLEQQLDRAESISSLDNVRRQMTTALQNLEQGVPNRYLVPGLERHYHEQRTKITAWVRSQLDALDQALGDFSRSAEAYDQWKKTREIELADAERRLASLYARMKMTPAKDQDSELWGYKYDHNGEWAIPARYYFAHEFNSEGEAIVGVDRKRETSRVKKRYLCSKEWRYVNVDTVYFKRSIIDKNGNQVHPPSSWEKTVPSGARSGFKLTMKCKN